jgi:hypothetical protein
MNGKTTNAAEMAPEPQERPREEEKPIKREKPSKKPGSVSRFFNQFGIGKYLEKLNDYYEYEEQMEAVAAEKEAKRETAEAMQIAGEEAVGEVKARGAEMPAQIEASAARAGAIAPEAAPVVAEAKAEEARVEEEAEVAAAEIKKEAEALAAGSESAGLPQVEKSAESAETKAGELPPGEFPSDSGFKIGDKVQVVRSSGELDPGWSLMVYNKEEKMAAVTKPDKNGKLMVKNIELDVLKDWQKLKAEAAEVEDIEVIEQKPLLDEMAEKIKAKYEVAPLEEVNARIKVLEDQMRAQDARHEEILEGLKSGKLYNSAELRAEQENMKEMEQVINAERNSLLKVREEKAKRAAEPMVSGEEFEKVRKEYEAKTEAEKEIPVYLAEEGLPSAEDIIKKHEVEKEMEEAKVEPVAFGEMKKAGKEMPPEREDIKPFEFSAAERKKIEAGLLVPKIPARLKARLPDLAGIMETVFMAKGREHDEKIINRMVKSLEKARKAYAAQKDAISKFDSQAFRKWVSETAGSIEVLKAAAEEMKPEKVVPLVSEKKKKKKAA